MTPIELANRLQLNILNTGEGNEREIKGAYCCDLLSIVMGRAKTDDAWITIMGNINSIAVAVLADVSCIILAEGMTLDKEAESKANSQNVCVLASPLPTFELACQVARVCGLE